MSDVKTVAVFGESVSASWNFSLSSLRPRCLRGHWTFRILLLFPGLRRFVYFVRRGAGGRAEPADLH